MTAPIIHLRINREGSFALATGARGDNQCGKEGQLQYKYFCTIEATNKSLTKEGYVMENLWTDEYFQQTYNGMPSAPSCEQMAQDAIKHFLNLFETHPELQQVDLRRIYIRIHGTPISFIEGEWNKDEK